MSSNGSPRPGDYIAFHGLVGAERGPCLVIGTQPLIDDPWRVHIQVLTARMGLRSLICISTEGLDWERVSRRIA